MLSRVLEVLWEIRWVSVDKIKFLNGFFFYYAELMKILEMNRSWKLELYSGVGRF